MTREREKEREREIETNRFFNDGNEIAKFIDKILVKYNDEPGIYYTGNTYRYFRNFKLVKRSEYCRGANELSIVLKYKAENYYIPKRNGAFSSVLTIFSKKLFAWFCSNSFSLLKEDQML